MTKYRSPPVSYTIGAENLYGKPAETPALVPDSPGGWRGTANYKKARRPQTKNNSRMTPVIAGINRVYHLKAAA